jgi:hypothetical protein
MRGGFLELIVLLALLRIAHDIISLGDFLEALFRGFISRIGIRVVFLRQLPVGLLDIRLRRFLSTPNVS